MRTLQLCSALCAGHNKWSKVKHIKGPKDEARGKMFMKFGMLIRIAVKGEFKNPVMFACSNVKYRYFKSAFNLQKVDLTRT